MSPFRSSAARAMAARGARQSASSSAAGQRRGEIGVGGDAPAGGVLVVLRLGDHVHGDPFGPGGPVGNDEDFGGSRDHVDPHPAHHLPLGLRHPAVSRPHDLVHPGDGPGPVGQGGDGLGPADPEDPGDPGQGAGGEHRVGDSLGGTTAMISCTPATRAGTAFITTDEG